jgi:hypothetical protein
LAPKLAALEGWGTMGEPEGSRSFDEFADALKTAFGRKDWGDHTVLAIAATYSDDQGNFEVALLDEGSGQPVWEPTRCNVNDPASEFDKVMDDVCNFYEQWQADRYGEFGEWKTTTTKPIERERK